MPALTLQLVVNVATHELPPGTLKNSSRYCNGDVVAAYPAEKYASRVGNEWIIDNKIGTDKSVFLHITGMTDDQVMRAIPRLTAATQLGTETYRRRKFRIPPSVWPLPLKDDILADKQATITWTQAKNLLRKKSITDAYDASTDDESTKVTDGDI